MLSLETTGLGPEEWQAIALSLKVAFWAALASLPFGIFMAYALARWDFPGRQLLNGLVHLPLVLPPVVDVMSYRADRPVCAVCQLNIDSIFLSGEGEVLERVLEQMRERREELWPQD